MTPREFYALYGPCVTRVIQVTSGTDFRLPADPDRYLFSVWRCAVDLSILPDGGELTTTLGYTLAAGSIPFTFTHAEHGALPSMGWRIGASGWIGTNNVLLVLGNASGWLKPSSKIRGTK